LLPEHLIKTIQVMVFIKGNLLLSKHIVHTQQTNQEQIYFFHLQVDRVTA